MALTFWVVCYTLKYIVAYRRAFIIAFYGTGPCSNISSHNLPNTQKPKFPTVGRGIMNQLGTLNPLK